MSMLPDVHMATPQEVGIFRPDRTTEKPGPLPESASPPGSRVRAETLPSLGFEVGIEVSVHDSRESGHALESSPRLFGSPPRSPRCDAGSELYCGFTVRVTGSSLHVTHLVH